MHYRQSDRHRVSIYQTARKTPTDGHRGRTAGHNENRSQYGNTNDQERIQCDNYNCQSNWGSIPIPGLKGGETMTDEKRTAAEAKRAETYRRKRESEQRRREELAAQKADIERARAICREIRDKADASDADKLKAVELLHILNE